MDNFTENVSKHFGLPWAGLIEHCRKAIKDKPPDPKISSQKLSSYDVTSRLHQEDASTFGLRPALDECLLTLCDQCGAVIKPQALYSHIEKRHKEASGDSSVQHLLTEKPIVKGLSSKAKNKNSPRNSPKLTANCETNLLDKYKLPKPPVNRIGGRFAPGSLEQSNSALAKQLRGGAQPVVALDDVSLSKSLASSSSIVGRSESLNDLTLTPKIAHITNSVADQPHTTTSSKQLPSKRSLDSILNAYPKSESPKKVKIEDTSVCNNEQTPSVIAQTPAILTPSPQDSTPVEDYSPKPLFSISESETSLINVHKQPKSPPKLHQITTFDKSIPCKDREYDPNRHCGCWLDEWGKHCTRSLTCKSHALSLRRKVPGRSKPFDTLLLEHREAKEALQLSKVKVNRKKPISSSIISNTKVQKPRSAPVAAPLFGESDVETSDTVQASTDCLGYSVIHPRPLAVACHGARLCGSSYVANRQLSSLRNILKQAIEKPRQTKKLCSTKSVKSVNGAAIKGNQYIHNSLPASSQTLLHNQSTAKVKGSLDKKKKAKRSSSADVAKTIHPPFSHRLASPPSIPTSPSQCLVRADSANIVKSGSAGAGPSTINLLTNGTSTQLIRANLLNDGGVWSTNRQKGTVADSAKAKLASRNSIHLPVNASNVTALSNKHLTLLDRLPYTLYPASGTTSSSVPSRQPDILSRSANGIVMQTSPAEKKTDNQQAMVLEILPKYTSTQTTHLNTNSLQYIKSDSNLSLTEGNRIQSRNPSEKVAQQFTITNSSTLSSLNSIRAMQQRQQSKTSSTVTIPLGSQPSLAQQPAIHHSGSNTATAHHGYG
ncbi:ataxin-7-like protein 2 [Watersipora subatra]|uniref:ataxin-7-like protein 2 n=1 Tax=Watersipora subatra TaxID=2589382 RepID=UPI00355B39B3